MCRRWCTVTWSISRSALKPLELPPYRSKPLPRRHGDRGVAQYVVAAFRRPAGFPQAQRATHAHSSVRHAACHRCHVPDGRGSAAQPHLPRFRRHVGRRRAGDTGDRHVAGGPGTKPPPIFFSTRDRWSPKYSIIRAVFSSSLWCWRLLPPGWYFLACISCWSARCAR